MYRINRLNRNVLITPDEVIFHAATDQDIEARQILQNIINAEERFIAITLGDSFYEDFINKKNIKITIENQDSILILLNKSLVANKGFEIKSEDVPVGTIINAIELVTDEWYVKLWERFLWKLTAECVDMMTIVPSWLRHTASGQMTNNPKSLESSGATSGDIKDVKFKIDTAIMDRIDPLTERMKMWLCQNKTHFLLYKNNCGSCGESAETLDGISHIRKTNFITNFYND